MNDDDQVAAELRKYTRKYKEVSKHLSAVGHMGALEDNLANMRRGIKEDKPVVIATYGMLASFHLHELLRHYQKEFDRGIEAAGGGNDGNDASAQTRTATAEEATNIIRGVFDKGKPQ